MNRCSHGVYLPEGETLAWGCQSCYPNGHPEEDSQQPIFNHRGALKLTGTGKLPKCPTCNVPVPVSDKGVCAICSTPFEINEATHLRANAKQPGICPGCGSGIHFETGNAKVWKCADCEQEYPAARTTEE